MPRDLTPDPVIDAARSTCDHPEIRSNVTAALLRAIVHHEGDSHLGLMLGSYLTGHRPWLLRDTETAEMAIVDFRHWAEELAAEMEASI